MGSGRDYSRGEPRLPVGTRVFLAETSRFYGQSRGKEGEIVGHWPWGAGEGFSYKVRWPGLGTYCYNDEDLIPIDFDDESEQQELQFYGQR